MQNSILVKIKTKRDESDNTLILHSHASSLARASFSFGAERQNVLMPYAVAAVAAIAVVAVAVVRLLILIYLFIFFCLDCLSSS